MLKIYIENDLLDLFQDESIELNSSIANVNDITKNTTDYAKSFTVPASNNNNKIFKHYYDANIDNAFDARVKVNGRIEFDGMPFRFGKWSLEKVILKQGKPYSYSINFVGNLVSLKDKLKNDELSILDFPLLDHDYNSDTVKSLLQNNGDVIYNLFVKKQLYYNPTSSTIIPTSINIAHATGEGIDWTYLNPSIRLIKIIEAIETKYEINFSRDFFDRIEFQNLFLWVNNTSLISGKENNEIRIDFTNTGTINEQGGDIDLINDTFTNRGRSIKVAINVTPSAGYETVPYSIEIRKDGDPSGAYTNVTGYRSNVFVNFERNSQTKYTWFVSSNQEFKFSSDLVVIFLYGGDPNQVASFPEQTIGANFIIKNNLPKIKIIDFLKGLFSMFKLVVISDDNENLYIDTIDNYYATGKVWNVTRYVKTDTLEVSRGNLLNEIKFTHKEPVTILNNQFKKSNGIGYGDAEILMTDDGTKSGKPLEGEALTFELPFEQFVYERLKDESSTEPYPNNMTNIMYGAIIDDKFEPVNPSPHIFYNVNSFHSGFPIGYINDLGVKEILNTTINTPSHSIDWATPQYNLNFGIENNEWDNTQSENTLYQNYYKNYITSIFNIKRRLFKYSAILPLRILLQLKLNDILEIKNNYYRIDNFNINLLTRAVTLNLINAFDAVINGFTSAVNELIADYLEQTQSVSIPNIGNSTVAVDDDTWLFATIEGTNVFVTFLQNNTGLPRFNNVTVTNLESLQTIEIFITQNAGVVEFDNDEITFDNLLITFDNG